MAVAPDRKLAITRTYQYNSIAVYGRAAQVNRREWLLHGPFPTSSSVSTKGRNRCKAAPFHTPNATTVGDPVNRITPASNTAAATPSITPMPMP